MNNSYRVEVEFDNRTTRVKPKTALAKKRPFSFGGGNFLCIGPKKNPTLCYNINDSDPFSSSHLVSIKQRQAPLEIEPFYPPIESNRSKDWKNRVHDAQSLEQDMHLKKKTQYFGGGEKNITYGNPKFRLNQLVRNEYIPNQDLFSDMSINPFGYYEEDYENNEPTVLEFNKFKEVKSPTFRTRPIHHPKTSDIHEKLSRTLMSTRTNRDHHPPANRSKPKTSAGCKNIKEEVIVSFADKPVIFQTDGFSPSKNKSQKEEIALILNELKGSSFDNRLCFSKENSVSKKVSSKISGTSLLNDIPIDNFIAKQKEQIRRYKNSIQKGKSGENAKGVSLDINYTSPTIGNAIQIINSMAKEANSLKLTAQNFNQTFHSSLSPSRAKVNAKPVHGKYQLNFSKAKNKTTYLDKLKKFTESHKIESIHEKSKTNEQDLPFISTRHSDLTSYSKLKNPNEKNNKNKKFLHSPYLKNKFYDKDVEKARLSNDDIKEIELLKRKTKIKEFFHSSKNVEEKKKVYDSLINKLHPNQFKDLGNRKLIQELYEYIIKKKEKFLEEQNENQENENIEHELIE